MTLPGWGADVQSRNQQGSTRLKTPFDFSNQSSRKLSSLLRSWHSPKPAHFSGAVVQFTGPMWFWPPCGSRAAWPSTSHLPRERELTICSFTAHQTAWIPGQALTARVKVAIAW